MARRFDGRNAADPEFPGSTWSYVQKDGRLVADRSEAGRRNTYPLEFVLGSGQHALTPVSVVGRDDRGRPLALEHRLSYFAHLGHLDVTPGQRAATNASGRTPEGRYLSAEETRMCFDCHATRASRDRPDALDPATMTPNVSCERCHGPGRAHLEAALRGEAKLSLPFGHGAETAEAQVRLCGQCHRLPEQVPPDQLRPDNAVLARFQPVGLMRSRCYTRSRGGLSCSTCHDPHARTSRDRAGYESACLSCHDAAPKTVCPTSPRAGCLDCHMPRRDAGNGLRFTDHWIRVHPEAAEGHR